MLLQSGQHLGQAALDVTVHREGPRPRTPGSWGENWPPRAAEETAHELARIAERQRTILLPRAGPNTACISAAPDGDLLVGIALSGAGSPAAVFGAAGLEALGRLRVPGRGPVLEQPNAGRGHGALLRPRSYRPLRAIGR